MNRQNRKNCGKVELVSLKHAIDVSSLPDNFVIFTSGNVSTIKGDFIFDEESSASVMAYAERWGIQFMVDLEHLSLDSECPNYNPDAMGWYDLEIRDGSLYAVNVKWTAEGERRLKAKSQRYISPTFAIDTETKKIVSLFNVALTSIPATHDAEPLIAASAPQTEKPKEVEKMDEYQAIRELLGLAEDADLEQIIEAIKALLSSVSANAEDTEEEPETANAEDPEEEPETANAEDPEEEVKTLRALVTSLSIRLARVDGKDKDAEKIAFIQANAAKIPPTLEDWAKKQTMETLRAFVKCAPTAAKPSKPFRNSAVKLSATENAVAKLYGVDPEKIAKYKAGIRN